MYFNEHDLNAAQWIRELFPNATVDSRDIQQVKGSDIERHRRAHFFAGIAGWEYALQLAGVSDGLPVWTGSCPCQPFSLAGKGKGTADERHLWPEFFRLIQESRPVLVFGEQVGKKPGREWLAGVQADLERAGYTFGAANLPACSVGAPHIRERLYWGAIRLGDPIHKRLEGFGASVRVGPGDCEGGGKVAASGNKGSFGLGDTRESGSWRDTGAVSGEKGQVERERVEPRCQPDQPVYAGADCNDLGRVGDPECAEWGQINSARRNDWRDVLPQRSQSTDRFRSSSQNGFWSRYDILQFTDRKARRVEPGSFPLVNGLPRRVGYSGDPRSPDYLQATAEARVMRLKGYGNAIVPHLAAVFIRCFIEAIGDVLTQ